MSLPIRRALVLGLFTLALKAAAASPEDAGLAAYRTGKCAEAIPLFRSALAQAADEGRAARILNNLGAAQFQCGEFRAAEESYLRAIERQFDARTRASTQNNLAVLYRGLARMEQAERAADAAVAEDPASATYWHTLAEVRRMRGNHAGAEAAFANAEKQPASPMIRANILSSRAALLVDQGRLEEGEAMSRQALTALKEAGGTTSQILTAEGGLGLALMALGRLDEAGQVLAETLRKAEAAFGPEHPRVATAANNLGQLRRRQKDYAAADPLYRRAMAIWAKSFGKRHPDYARGLHNLGSLFVEEGKTRGAERLYREALEIAHEAWGGSHPQTVQHRQALEGLYQTMGRTQSLQQLQNSFR